MPRAAASKELAATSEDMSSQAEKMQQLMSFFRMTAGNIAKEMK